MVEMLFVLMVCSVLSLGLLILNKTLKIVSVQSIVKDHCHNWRYGNKNGWIVTLSPLYPNNICYIRVFVAWVAIGAYCFGWQYVGIALYLLAVFFDAVDGMVARRCDLVTKAGEKIDPLCDKLTYLAPIAYFGISGVLSVIPTVLFIIFELSGQSVVRKILTCRGQSVAANNFGKMKAILAFSLMPYIFVVQNYQQIPDISRYIIIMCVVLSLCSAVFKLIPNRFYADILSILNLLCGATSTVLILEGSLIGAVLVVILGQVFDFFDGRMAIKHGGTEIGPWLDDLADSISFGFCPALLIWKIGDGYWFNVVAIIFFSSILLRLLRFVLVDKKRGDHQDHIFFGLPSPAGALIVMGVCLVTHNFLIVGSITILVSILSVSTYKFVHLGKGIAKKLPKTLIVVLGTIMLVALAYFVKTESQIGIGYFLLASSLLYVVTSELVKKQFADQ